MARMPSRDPQPAELALPLYASATGNVLCLFRYPFLVWHPYVYAEEPEIDDAIRFASILKKGFNEETDNGDYDDVSRAKTLA